jgi:hypothetical protein
MIRILLPSIVLLARVASAIDITTCGQTVPSFDVGMLQADLVCPNPNTSEGCIASGMGAPAAVDLQANATLQMNGHSITGGCFGVRAFTDSSRRRVAIQGPGLITGAFVGVFFRGRLTISDVTLDGNGGGIVSPDPSTNKSRIFATNVAANNSGGPVEGIGITAYRIDATSVTASGNVTGLYAFSRLRANGVTANDNAYGVYSPGKVAIDGLTATNSTYYGVAARRLRLRTSTVTGSQVDLWTQSRPSVTAVTCDTSGSQTNPPIPWGVCAKD